MAFDIQAVLPSAARGAGTITSAAVPTHGAKSLGIGISVTAASGTPTLDIKVQWSFDGTNFGDGEPVVSFAQITGIKETNLVTSVRAPYYRLSATTGGTTPSFTWSATGYTY